MRTEKIILLYEIMSPLTHMMGVQGNESVINREPVMTEEGKRYVPILSGNAIRHVMIRKAGIDNLFDLLNIQKLENIDQLNFLYNGGALTESSITDSIEKIQMIWNKLPLLKLLGGSLRNQIIRGMMQVGRGTLICEENRRTLHYILNKNHLEKLPELLLSAEMFIGKYQYTRGDASKQEADKIKVEDKKGFFDIEKNKKEKSNLMLYSGQSVISGAMFINEFILQDVSDLEIGAFFSALKYWQENKSVMGGYSRIGHGKVKINLLSDYTNDKINEYINKYEDHIKRQDDFLSFMDFLFPGKVKKNEKS
jgi:hypothetical protein